MDNQSEILKQIQQELAQKADKSWVDSRLDQQDRTMEAMFLAMKAGFEQVDGRFEQVDKRFEKMDERFERMDERFERMECRQLEQDLKMEDWRSDCRAFTEGWKQNQFRLELVEARVYDLESKSA